MFAKSLSLIQTYFNAVAEVAKTSELLNSASGFASPTSAVPNSGESGHGLSTMNLLNEPVELWFFELVICSTLLILLAWLLTTFVRRWSAAVRHRVWFFAFCSLVVLPFALLFLPSWNLPLLPPVDAQKDAVALAEPPSNDQVKAPSPGESEDRPELTGADLQAPPYLTGEFSTQAPVSFPRTENKDIADNDSNAALESQSIAALSKDHSTDESGQVRSRRRAVSTMFLMAWLIGVAISAIPVVVALMNFRRLLSKSNKIDDPLWHQLLFELRAALNLKHAVQLFRFSRPWMPMTWGVTRPVIGLPNDCDSWTHSRRSAVLLHELSHIKRGDVFAQTFSRLVCGLYWFHPLVWFALRRLRIERELACDDCVVASGQKPSDYAQQLVEIARSFQPRRTALGVAIATTSKLEHRIQSLLDFARSHVPVSQRLSRVLLISSLVAIVGLATIRIGHQTAGVAEVARTSDSEVSNSSGVLNSSETPDSGESGYVDETGERTIRGKVVDPDGNPVGNAEVVLHGVFTNSIHESEYNEVARVAAGTDGRFEIPLTDKMRQQLKAMKPESKHRSLQVLALHDDFGPDWRGGFSIDFEFFNKTNIELKLARATVDIQGRIVDLEGNPIVGALVHATVIRYSNKDIGKWLERARQNPVAINEMDTIRMGGMGPKVVRFPGYNSMELDVLSDKVAAVVHKTDERGRFRLDGPGDDRLVTFEVTGSGIASTRFQVLTRDVKPIPMPHEGHGKAQKVFGCKFDLPVEPERLIEGKVTDRKTGKPVEGVALSIFGYTHYPNYRSFRNGTGVITTDEHGRYRFTGIARPADGARQLQLQILPAKDQPYFSNDILLPPQHSFEPLKFDIELNPGRTVSGRLVDGETGKPVPGSVMYYPYLDNENAEDYDNFETNTMSLSMDASVDTDGEGNFSINVIDGQGVLCVTAEKSERYSIGDGGSELGLKFESDFTSQKIYHMPGTGHFNTIHQIDIDENNKDKNIQIGLNPLESSTLRIVNADGAEATDLQVVGQFPQSPLSLRYSLNSGMDEVSSPIEVLGLDESEKRQLIVFSKTNSQGIVTTINSNTTGPVRLEPCATIRGKIVSTDKWEPANAHIYAILPKSAAPQPMTQRPLATRDHRLANATLNEDGLFEIKDVIPGAPCTVRIQTAGKIKRVKIVKPVQPGQAIDLGTVDLDKPDETFVAEVAKTSVLKPSGSETPNSGESGYVSKENVSKENMSKEIKGVVRLPSGKIAAGAEVQLVHTKSFKPHWNMTSRVVDTAHTDDSGRFEFQISAELLAKAGDQGDHLSSLHVFATGDGYPPVWLPVANFHTPLKKNVDLPFAGDGLLEGRLLDREGNPLPNVSVKVHSVSPTMDSDALDQWLVKAENNPQTASFMTASAITGSGEPAVHRLPVHSQIQTNGLPVFQQKVETDSEGRFKLTGLGEDREVVLEIEDSRVPRCRILTVTRKFDPVPHPTGDPRYGSTFCYGANFDFVAPAAREITGTVSETKSGNPIPGATIELETYGRGRNLSIDGFVSAKTDDQGKYKLVVRDSGNHELPILNIIPPRDQPFFKLDNISIPEPGDSGAVTFNVRLKKAMFVEGTLINKKTGQPVKGRVGFVPFLNNDNARGYSNFRPNSQSFGPLTVPSDEKGNFRITAIPGEGFLFAIANEPWYFKTGVCDQEVLADEMDYEQRKVYHLVTAQQMNSGKVVSLDADANEPIKLELTPCDEKTVRFVDSEGNPVHGVQAVGQFPLSILSPQRILGAVPSSRDNTAVLYGLPKNGRLVMFHQPDLNLGLATVMRPDSPDQVTLLPCSTIVCKVVSSGTGRIGLSGRYPDPTWRGESDVRPQPGNFTRTVWAENETVEMKGILPGSRFEFLLGGKLVEKFSFEGEEDCVPLKPGQKYDLGTIDADKIDELIEQRKKQSGKTGRKDVAEVAKTSDDPNSSNVAEVAKTSDSGVSNFSDFLNSGESGYKTISGMIADSSGKPVAGEIWLVGTGKNTRAGPIGRSSANGTFEVSLKHSAQHELRSAQLVAVADDFGPDWIKLSEFQDGYSFQLVRDDVPINGQILDLEGNPVQGATIRVDSIRVPENDQLSRYINVVKTGNGANFRFKKYLFNPPIKRTKTDANGRFRLSGVGANRRVDLIVSGDSIAHQTIHVITKESTVIRSRRSNSDFDRETVYGATFKHLARPGRVIRGTVVDSKTLKAVEAVTVNVLNSAASAKTDKDGRFELQGAPKGESYPLIASVNDGQYLIGSKMLDDTPGLKPLNVELKVPRGMTLSGRVVDAKSGKPVEARISYFPVFPNNEIEQGDGYSEVPAGGDWAWAKTDAEGNFAIAAMAGPGFLGVTAKDRSRYETAEVDAAAFFKDKVSAYGGQMANSPSADNLIFAASGPNQTIPMPKSNWQAIKLLMIDPERNSDLNCEIQLVPAGSVEGRIVDSKDQQLRDVRIYGATSGNSGRMSKDGRFSVDGLGKNEQRRLIFLQEERKLAAAMTVKKTDGSLTVQMQPWGEVKGRLLDEKGQPLRNLGLYSSPPDANRESYGFLPELQTTDDEGRFHIKGLVSGLTYYLRSNERVQPAVVVTPETGEVIDVGDISPEPDETSDSPNSGNVAEVAKTSDSKISDSKNPNSGESGYRTIGGTVVDSSGKPVERASVAVIAMNIDRVERSFRSRGNDDILAEAKTGKDGKFQLDLGNVSSKTHRHAGLICRGVRTAVAWQRFDLDQLPKNISLTLKSEQIIRGRLVDIEGQSAANITFRVHGITKRGKPLRTAGKGYRATKDSRAWIAPITTDQYGRFEIPGVAADCGVFLTVEGNERFSTQEIAINLGMSESREAGDATYRPLVANVKAGEEATIALNPARTFNGKITFADTGEAVPNAKVEISASQQENGSMFSITGQADEKGNYKLSPRPGIRFGVTAFPPDGLPYLIRQIEPIKWDDGSSERTQNVELPRGVLARGVVRNKLTGKPIENVSVQYRSESSNNDFNSDDIVKGWRGIQRTGADGKFSIAVLPGPGRLLFHAGKQANYVSHIIGSREISLGKSGGTRHYIHAARKLNPEPNSEPIGLDPIELQPGATVIGKVLDETGKPVDEFTIMTSLHIFPTVLRWRSAGLTSLKGKQGAFELHGLADGETYKVHFFDPERRIGATANLKAGDEPSIQLQPYGGATMQLVDESGNPVKQFRPVLYFVMTPGTNAEMGMDRAEYRADSDFIQNVDRINNPELQKSDDQGWLEFKSLIPGATYRLVHFNRNQVLKEFVAESGKTLDLGEVKMPAEE